MVGETMTFDPHSYQSTIWNKLRKITLSNRVGSAYLFGGQEGSAKEALALSFAASLNCQHKTKPCGFCSSCIRFTSMQHEHLHIITPLPRAKQTGGKDSDVLSIIGGGNKELLIELLRQKGQDPFQKIVLPNSNRILINSIRELHNKLYLKSTDFGYKTVLIFDAHYLSVGDGASANALLKILEEPPEKTVFILVTDHKSALLPTIQSRCQQIDFPPINNRIIRKYLEENEVDQQNSIIYAHLSDGNIHRARTLLKQPIKIIMEDMKQQVETVINADSGGWRKYIDSMSRLIRTDRKKFNFDLFLMQTWFREYYRSQKGLEAPLMHNEFLRIKETISRSFPNADFSAINSIIEKVLIAKDNNLYMPLTLTNMLINIQNSLKGKREHAE